jgi:putative membrane protein
MVILIKLLAGLIALEHLYFLVLEMFLWTSPRALKSFGSSLEFAQATRTLAGNQGLYNGFLAAGLVWGLFHPDLKVAYQILVFFLVCVLVAGVYGGVTAKRSILWIQGLPALITLVALAFLQ